MKVIFRNTYIVDHETNQIDFKDIRTKDFDVYVRNLLININKSASMAEYKTRDNGTTQVMSQSKLLTELCLEDEINEEEVKKHVQIIANRFLEKEKKAQEKIIRMGIKIKIGCLIFAVIQKGEEFQLLIAKLESLSGLDLKKFTHQDIIEDNEKKFGKSCLLNFFYDNESLKIGKIHILLDNKAKYFTEEFLEIDPMYVDDYCTEIVSTSILSLVDNELRKEYPRERQLIRNSFIMYMRKNEFIDYNNLIEEVFTEYFDSESCKINKEKKDKIRDKLNALPDKKKFSKQFNCIKDKINARLIKSEYKLSDDLDLVIHESKMKETNGQNDIFDRIISESELDGRTYLKIYTDNTDTLKTFKKID